MRAPVTAWWAPKAGNAADEYEDAYAVEPAALRYAVADGASETSFAKQWAELLVERFVHEPPAPAELPGWLAPMQRAWAALARAATREAFGGFVDYLRHGGALRNDDVTLVRVEVEP